jgi:transcription elongation factor GreA
MSLGIHNNPPVNRVYLTLSGYEKLNSELDYLRTIRRSEIAANLHDLIDVGEIEENSSYLLAKDEQALVEGRIRELEHILHRVEIVGTGEVSSEVKIGSRVTIQEDAMPFEYYTIVGSAEVDTRQKMISYESPLGRALLGCRAGDIVEVRAPNSSYSVRIIQID